MVIQSFIRLFLVFVRLSVSGIKYTNTLFFFEVRLQDNAVCEVSSYNLVFHDRF